MGIKERKSRQKAELRQKILDAAVSIINSNGAETLTMRGIARKIEYSPRTVYLYFANKDALMQALIEYGFGRSLSLYPGLDSDNPVAIRHHIGQQLRQNIQMALDNKPYYQAVTSLILSRGYPPGPNQKQLMAYVAYDFEKYYKCLNREVADVKERIFLLFAMLRGFNLSLINHEQEYAPTEKQALIDRFITSVFQGVLDS